MEFTLFLAESYIEDPVTICDDRAISAQIVWHTLAHRARLYFEEEKMSSLEKWQF